MWYEDKFHTPKYAPNYLSQFVQLKKGENFIELTYFISFLSRKENKAVLANRRIVLNHLYLICFKFGG